jgi:hypothetical protein
VALFRTKDVVEWFGVVWRALAGCVFSGWGMVGNFGEFVECGTETLRHRGEWDEVGLLLVRILCLLQDLAAMREWDLARAAKAEKVSFWADIEGLFFIFGIGGGARASGRERRGARTSAWLNVPVRFTIPVPLAWANDCVW